jgi:CRP/FNR family nitrogen fixation transcriptional regulator
MSIQAQSLDPSRQHLGVVKSYSAKNEIIGEDDPADRIYEVISGAVFTYRVLKEGRRQIGGFYFPGDIFGLEFEEKRNLGAEAITNAKVRIAKKPALNALMSRDAGVADRLLSMTAVELARKQDLALILSRSAEDRVIYFLIDNEPTDFPKGVCHRVTDDPSAYRGLPWAYA